jgi:hypothetical protein
LFYVRPYADIKFFPVLTASQVLPFVVVSVQFYGFVHHVLARLQVTSGGLAKAGAHCHCCGLQTFIFAQLFLRGYTPACAKPLVVGSPFYLVIPVKIHTLLSSYSDTFALESKTAKP